MSPKKGPGHSGNGGGRELQALLDAAVVQIADKDDAAGQIPWRTSRRLQEATLRSLVNEHESENLSLAKGKASSEVLSVRPLKRHRSPSSPTTPLDVCQVEDTDVSSPTTPSDVCQVEDTDDRQGSGDSSVDEDCSSSARKGIIICGENVGSRRKKKKTVHLANPLVCYIEDKILEKSTSKPVAGKVSVHGARNESKGSPKLGGGARHPPKIPMSCFDLLCNYSKATGWKCYRSRVEGETMCSFHVSSRKATSPPIRNLRL